MRDGAEVGVEAASVAITIGRGYEGADGGSEGLGIGLVDDLLLCGQGILREVG